MEADLSTYKALQQLLANLPPPLPSSPTHPTPPRVARGGAAASPPGGADGGAAPADALPPTPSVVAHHVSVPPGGGGRVLHEQLYSPDGTPGRSAPGPIQLWRMSPERPAEEHNHPAGDRTPVPGPTGAPVPAFEYGSGAAPYPARPSHPVHPRSGAPAVGSEASKPKPIGAMPRHAPYSEDDSDEEGGGELVALLAEGGEAAAVAGSAPHTEAGALGDGGAVALQTPHSAAKRSPLKRSKFASPLSAPLTTSDSPLICEGSTEASRTDANSTIS